MQRNDRLDITHAPVDDAVHEFVALCVETASRVRLRDAARKLAVAEVVIWGDRNLRRACQFRLRRIVPVHVKRPVVDAVVVEDFLQLRATGGENQIRRACRRQSPSVEVRGIEEVHVLHDDALLSGTEPPKHSCTVHHARVLLDDVVTGTRADVVTVRPDREPGIVRKERPQELVLVVRPERVRADAHGIADRERTGRVVGWSPEDWHYHEPSIGELVILHDGVAVIARLTLSAESLEDGVGGR